MIASVALFTALIATPWTPSTACPVVTSERIEELKYPRPQTPLRRRSSGCACPWRLPQAVPPVCLAHLEVPRRIGDAPPGGPCGSFQTGQRVLAGSARAMLTISRRLRRWRQWAIPARTARPRTSARCFKPPPKRRCTSADREKPHVSICRAALARVRRPPEEGQQSAADGTKDRCLPRAPPRTKAAPVARDVPAIIEDPASEPRPEPPAAPSLR